jgi:hypothetical protein
MAAGGSLLKHVRSVLLCETAGGIGGVFSNEVVKSWCPKFKKPSFSRFRTSQRTRSDGRWCSSRILYRCRCSLIQVVFS